MTGEVLWSAFPWTKWLGVFVMMFNATFNNILVLSWWIVLLMLETGENHDLSQVTDKLSHNVVSSTLRHERDSNSQLSGDGH